MGSCLSSDGGGGGWGIPRPSSLPSSSSSGKKQKGGGGGSRRWPRGGSRDSASSQLQRIPGRMHLNGASGVASMFTQQGRKGTNQDAMIVWENFGSRMDTIFCGVFDGHGPYGHVVARRVRDQLPLKLSSQWEANVFGDNCKENAGSALGSTNSDEASPLCPDVSVGLEEKDECPEFLATIKESFLKAFKVMDKELQLHPGIDCFCSGTTAVTLVKKGRDLVIGNVGDSRAVLGTRDHNDCLIAVQLTVDLKPNLPREAERIMGCRGRVFALRDEPEVARVWLPNTDSPGLAMARALGDFCLKDFGLISVPELSYRSLSEKDEFVVLATDGVWDVLTNEEVVDIVASAPRSTATRYLVEAAVRGWRYKYPSSKVDDCAVVCLYLDSDTSTSYDLNTKQGGAISPDTEGTTANDDGSNGDPKSVPRARSRRQQPPDGGEASAAAADDWEAWSALEGVSRVNTLVALPRYRATESKTKK